MSLPCSQRRQKKVHESLPSVCSVSEIISTSLSLSFSICFVFAPLSEQGMQIHISQTTKDHLEHDPYIIEERGKIFVKVSGPIPVLDASKLRADHQEISVMHQVFPLPLL